MFASGWIGLELQGAKAVLAQVGFLLRSARVVGHGGVVNAAACLALFANQEVDSHADTNLVTEHVAAFAPAAARHWFRASRPSGQ